MSRIRRAIIMAAGIGKRLQPLTLETPKPLISVNGTRMIDSAINGLHKNGITEIYIVVGHLKEQFYQLESLYPGVTIIENPYYETCNNISSLYVARDYIEEAIILDGDQIIYNPAVLQPDFDRSGYNCIWTEHETDEWLLSVENGIVKKHLELEFEKNKNYQIYWDDIAIFCHANDYELGIYKMNPGDVIEIDNISELARLDHRYQIYVKK